MSIYVHIYVYMVC